MIKVHNAKNITFRKNDYFFSSYYFYFFSRIFMRYLFIFVSKQNSYLMLHYFIQFLSTFPSCFDEIVCFMSLILVFILNALRIRFKFLDFLDFQINRYLDLEVFFQLRVSFQINFFICDKLLLVVFLLIICIL